MPVETLTDAYVSINSVDLSDHVESVQLETTVDIQEAPVMGDGAVRRLAGLKDWNVTINFRQDFDASKVDATLWPLRGVETAIAIRKSKTDAISATNPEYQGSGILHSYPIVAGSVSQVHNVSVQIAGSDGADLTRATS